MELGPVVRALWNHRSRFWLISVEVALTLAIVANCFNIILEQRERIARETGLDEANLISVFSEPFDPAYADEDHVRAMGQADVRALQAIPGVHAAAASHQLPLSGGGSSTSRRRPDQAEVDTVGVNYFVVTQSAVDTYGVEIVAGRDFIESDFPTAEQRDAEAELDRTQTPVVRNVIVTREAADQFYPDGDALGKRIVSRGGETENVIVGIIDHMHGSWPLSPLAGRVMLYPGEPFGSRFTRYVVRTEPGAVEAVYSAIEPALLEVDDGRIVSLIGFPEMKADYYRSLSALSGLLSVVSLLLLVVTGLGIVGLTSFSVTQRRRQIGTRRALGATRWAILRLFLLENWVVTGAGLVLGVGLTYGINFMLSHAADAPRMPLGTVAAGMLLLWGIGLLAAALPAARATFVPPVVATRTV